MEAALWGRIDNIKHLLEYSTNRNLCDIYGRQAAKLAPIVEFHILNEWKTITSLQRPSNYPLIAAISG